MIFTVRQGHQDVVRMGIDKYNEECRGIVLRFTAEWRRIVERLGRWIDFDNDYKTMDRSFMERPKGKESGFDMDFTWMSLDVAWFLPGFTMLLHYCTCFDLLLECVYFFLHVFTRFHGTNQVVLNVFVLVRVALRRNSWPAAGGSSKSSTTRAWSIGPSE